MDFQFATDRPIYIQLVEQLERKIATNVYAPGQRIPGVREMAANFGVNPNTMQRALSELEAKNLLYTERTNGRFVTSDSELIAQTRNSIALELAKTYTTKMNALGYENSEIVAFLQKNQQEFK